MASLYNSTHFKMDDAATLHRFVRQYPLATLITHGADGLTASHVPMLLEETGSGFVLRGHIARANGHWKNLGDGVDALAIFNGPQAYVTPQWYPSKLKDGKVVPTWNYAVTHVRGTLRAVHDTAWLHRLVSALTSEHEKAFAHQWAVTDAPDDYVERMLKAIVGLELTITSIEGKWKLSQNRDAADYSGTKNGLAARGTPDTDAVNALMPPR
ncbi:MAG: FMN-binding negative transcriptional regulator [Rhodospirillaceae bacterium]|nr:FMN-binding negative transcriptional regulator [Rhodospirillaceae bacterium]